MMPPPNHEIDSEEEGLSEEDLCILRERDEQLACYMEARLREFERLDHIINGTSAKMN